MTKFASSQGGNMQRFKAVLITALAFLFTACNDALPPANEGVVLATPSEPSSMLLPTGMAAPIADQRYWDGTYTGTPGTGTIGYTTLWRDNEDNGAVSGYSGEGSGKHPGVDIRIGSNNPVYASLTGKIVSYTCNWNGSRSLSSSTGWGGQVIIKSANPYVSGDSIYFSYNHLNKWDYYPVGTVVSTGTQIGLSGGNPTSDVCPGHSGGAHLHFQIDKSSPAHTIPFWSSTSVNVADNNFEIATYTYNPVPFVRADITGPFGKRPQAVNLKNIGPLTVRYL